jgi:hypothetical protein
MKDLKPMLPVLGVVVVIIALFAWGIASKKDKPVVYVPGTEVVCLPQGHQNLATHIHSVMTVTVDGVNEILPANIGITADCMAEVHTHDTTGTVHVETVSADRLNVLTLADFFTIWGKPLAREGYVATLVVDGATIIDPEMTRFRDGQKIALSYTSIAQ